jgi:hypothetical protein
MHSSQLNVLALILQANIDGVASISVERMSLLAQQYWTISRSRLTFWNHGLAFVQKTLVKSGTVSQPFAERAEQLIEEILLSQLHGRVWGGLLAYYDSRQGSGADERLVGLGISTAEGHAETAERARDLLLDLGRQQPAAMVRQERLQRRMERWTDRLLSGLATAVDVRPFCFDGQRIEDLVEVQGKMSELPTLSLLMSGLQAAQMEVGRRGFAGPMNYDLGCLMLGCLPWQALSEFRMSLDISIMRTDQATWEMDCLLERAMCLDLAASS